MKHLTNLPSNSTVFIDTNLLSYIFIRKDELAQTTTRFLARGSNREIQVVTSTSVVEDVIHRIMVFEAVTAHGIEPARAVTYLKKHPNLVRTLAQSLNVPSHLYNQLNINILPVTHIELHASQRIRAEYGLMTGDSVIVATMQRHKIVHLATNDRDFDRVKEIQVWSP